MAKSEPCEICGVMTTGWIVMSPMCDECYDHLARTRLINDPEERRAADEAYDKSKSSDSEVKL